MYKEQIHTVKMYIKQLILLKLILKMHKNSIWKIFRSFMASLQKLGPRPIFIDFFLHHNTERKYHYFCFIATLMMPQI